MAKTHRTKKLTGILVISLFLPGCGDKLEEFTFRKTIEHELIDLCGKKDPKCIKAVKTQAKGCMEKSNWRKYLNNRNDKLELKRFTKEFYACIVDSEGNPYFVPNK